MMIYLFIYLNVAFGLLHFRRQQVTVSVHGDPAEATPGVFAGDGAKFAEKLPGRGEDDDPGVRHDDLAAGADTHRGQLLELPLVLSLDTDLLLELATGLEDKDAADSVVRDEDLVIVVHSHSNGFDQVVVRKS